jgi:hypothetical protein
MRDREISSRRRMGVLARKEFARVEEWMDGAIG